jgi:hypothetical protein
MCGTGFVNPEHIMVRLPCKKTFDVAAALHEVVANGLKLVLEYFLPSIFN